MAKLSDTQRDQTRTSIAKGRALSRRAARRLKLAKAIFAASAFPALHAL